MGRGIFLSAAKVWDVLHAQASKKVIEGSLFPPLLRGHQRMLNGATGSYFTGYRKDAYRIWFFIKSSQ
jgi:hypothetical protein